MSQGGGVTSRLPHVPFRYSLTVWLTNGKRYVIQAFLGGGGLAGKSQCLIDAKRHHARDLMSRELLIS